MIKSNIYVLKLKRNIIPMAFLLFTFGLLIFANNNIVAVKNGLLLFANNVVPTLFPFFIATELLMHTNILYIIGRLFTPIMMPLFNIRGEGAFAFIMGLISGYPIGAKIAVNLRKNNICSKEECERLLSFTNNSGPLFIIGTVGITMFGNINIGILLFITHILASFTVGFLFRFWKNNHIKNNQQNIIKKPENNLVNLKNLGEIMAESITSSIKTILLIGGFIIVFSSIISIFNSSGLIKLITTSLSPIFRAINIDTSFIQGIFTGLLELTNGLSFISNIHVKALSINIIISSFLLGFGGLSIMFQVLSIISKSDLSCKPYVIGKILQAFLATFYTYILINLLPFFQFDI
ncbi:MAG: sporulation integral membrane protein YlbJ [Clostridia bacterium]|nr:sporulation integral membrane protein YlbJ [Clostridia bacterium]